MGLRQTSSDTGTIDYYSLELNSNLEPEEKSNFETD